MAQWKKDLLANAGSPFEGKRGPKPVNAQSQGTHRVPFGARFSRNILKMVRDAYPLSWKGETTIVLKRSMASGYAGVGNPLFVLENTRMLFGDANATMQAVLKALKG